MLWVAVFVALLWLGIRLDSNARRSALNLTVATLAAVGWRSSAPESHADNKRLNDGVVANVYTVQHKAAAAMRATMHQFYCGPAPERPFRVKPTAVNRQEARSS
jgi:hypothetical protein